MDIADEKKPVSQGEPTTAILEDQDPKGSFRDFFLNEKIFRYADRLDWMLNAVAVLCSIAAGASLPLMTIIFGNFTTKFNNFGSGLLAADVFKSDVDKQVLYFIYLFVARFALSYTSTICVNIAATRTTRALRQAFLESTLRQEVWHFDKQSIGAAATQVTTNGNRINTGIAEKLAFVFQAVSLLISSFIVAIVIQWKLALITMSVIPGIFLVTGVLIGMDAVIEANITKIYSRAAVLAQEAIGSVRTVHAFWAQDKMVKKYNVFLEEAHVEGNKKCPLYGILFATDYFFIYSGTALCFWQGFRMYQSGEIPNVGTVVTVVLSVIVGSQAISTVTPQIQPITAAASAASELFSIIDKPSLLDPMNEAGLRPGSCDGNVEVRDLRFSYPSRPDAQVLHGVNLSIPAGKTTALVGASGCGKSTLVGLIERWYLPSAGQIILDNKEISEYNVQWLRSKVRLVQQEPVLFRGTIFQNVAKGFVDEQLNLSYEQQLKLVQEACKSSNAHDFVEELPNGYNTEVGERAGMLSGGQKQRIAIARSIISDPKVLLLDEATSALDPRAEKIVQDALNRVSINRTTLVIAHKLATVKNADNIVVMSYGKVIEQGTHDELISKDGNYAALVRAQDLGGEKGEVEQYDEKAMEEALDRPVALERTKTEASMAVDVEAQQFTKETLGYSLLRCMAIMFLEQKNLYWCFAISSVACLVGGATYPAQALLFARVFHVFELTGAYAKSQADFYSLMFFVVALGNLVAYFAVGWMCNIVGQTVTHRYRREMFEQVLSQDMDFFDRPNNSSGALTSKLSSVPTDLMELISANMLLLFIIIVNILASSILALAYGWKLGCVVVFGGLPVLLLSGYGRIRLEMKLEAQKVQSYAESASLATEAVTSIRTVASLTLERQILDEYTGLLGNIVSRTIRGNLFLTIWYALSQSLEFLVMALGFWYGSRLLASGEYTTTQFFIIFISVVFGGQAAAMFFGYSTSLTKATGAANYILWLRTLKPKITETPGNKDTGPEGDGPIDISDVHFRYPQRDASRVLRGIAMHIPAGSFIATVGPSGCGKSTLISLLERFYDPTSGSINLNKQNITKFSPRLYRSYISLVQQEPTLYQGSVIENVCLGLSQSVDEETVLNALRQANAYDFVTSLPEGLQTPCGSRGMSFSGGQRQRIAIARALIRNPRLLLLDEATSALDTQSERLVQETLDRAGSGRTTIAVAHRLSTIRNADVIFVFGSGKIVEMGTHEELQKQRGRYWEMCLAQSLDRA